MASVFLDANVFLYAVGGEGPYRQPCRALLQAVGDGGLEAVDPRDQESKGLSADLVVLSAEGANGLEFDAVVVVEPGQIVNRGSENGASVTPRGLRTLYVSLTRPTRRLAVIASEELPATLR